MFSLQEYFEPLAVVRASRIGRRVIRCSQAFDRNERVRSLVLRHFLSRDAYVLDEVEPAHLSRRLRDWPSHVWWREAVAG